MKPRTQSKTKVGIEEVVPDVDQVADQLIKDPVKLRGAIRQSIKHAERRLRIKQKRRESAEKARNEKNTQRKKTIAFEIANRLRQKEPRLQLPRTANRLAGRIQALWPKEESPLSRRTIRRWLTEK